MRVLSSRCSMWKLTRVPRAPEYSRTGSEMRPKVRYPVQTEAAMAHSYLVLGNSVVRCAAASFCGQSSPPCCHLIFAEAPQEPSPERSRRGGRAPARTHLRGKPESKDLYFRALTCRTASR